MKVVALVLSVAALVLGQDDEQGKGQLRRRVLSTEGSRANFLFDPKSVETKAAGYPQQTHDEPLRRKFISYTSSEWEQIWIDHVDTWAANKEICERLNHPGHMQYVHDFLNLTCSVRYQTPYNNWCIIDDEVVPLWYNSAARDEYQLFWVEPELLADAKLDGTVQPVVPTEKDEHIVSKFVFEDQRTGEQYVEYIEPLVSHLRFPLCHCVAGVPSDGHYQYSPVKFRGWVIPPPPSMRQDRRLYFDAGASDWNNGSGGPSLKYFVNVWARAGIKFDDIYAFEMNTKAETFYDTVPREFKLITNYQQCAVSSQPQEHSKEHPFLPSLIKEKARDNDYVLFKLDIDSPHVENGNIDFILQDPDTHIDELVWEHHVAGNYLMTEWGDPKLLDQVSLRGSYEYFLRMRQKGIRAHSWV